MGSRLALWPLGHRFAAGHRIRLQVSSGAHPRYARNPGTGEDPATATRLQAVTLTIHHGVRHPSVLILPRPDRVPAMAGPTLTLHGLAPSHPCMTAEAALRLKGLEYERIDFTPGEHVEQMQSIYGEGNSTVPGLLVDAEPVHGSRAILARLEAIAPEPPLFPEPIAAAVREAERWGDEELQDLGRRLPWAALHFRPDALGSFGGAGALDPAGTDFAMRVAKASWRYHGITAVRLAQDLAGLPAKLDHVDELVSDGVIGGDQPTAADLQIGATIRVLLTVGDLHPLLAQRPAATLAQSWFPEYSGLVPAGAYPAGWVPPRER